MIFLYPKYNSQVFLTSVIFPIFMRVQEIESFLTKLSMRSLKHLNIYKKNQISSIIDKN